MKYIIAGFLISLSILFLQLQARQTAALEEIALNCGEISMSLDNIMHIKDEVMIDLEEHLPGWAWKGER